jgi:hypothetical protein
MPCVIFKIMDSLAILASIRLIPILVLPKKE